MKTKIAILSAALILSASAMADTTLILNPGPGTQYLAAWCGGQNVNEYSLGWNADSTAKTLVTVSTRCNGSGRGAKVRTITAAWFVDFARDGTIVSAVPADGSFDLPLVDVDGALLFDVTVQYVSGSLRTGTRAAITIPDAPVAADAPAVDAPVADEQP